eukprot:scaffold69234_cov30-Tisochrysis_lutea.AAC.2
MLNSKVWPPLTPTGISHRRRLFAHPGVGSMKSARRPSKMTPRQRDVESVEADPQGVRHPRAVEARARTVALTVSRAISLSRLAVGHRGGCPLSREHAQPKVSLPRLTSLAQGRHVKPKPRTMQQQPHGPAGSKAARFWSRALRENIENLCVPPHATDSSLDAIASFPLRHVRQRPSSYRSRTHRPLLPVKCKAPQSHPNRIAVCIHRDNFGLNPCT